MDNNIKKISDLYIEEYFKSEIELNIIKYNIWLDYKSVLIDLVQYLGEFTYKKIVKTIVYDINQKRVNHKYNSDTLEEQYIEYFTLLNLDELRKTYSKLFKQIDISISNIIDYFFTIINAYIKDYNHLIDIFGVYGKIIHVEFAEGDTHKGNKSVCKVVLEKGCLYYKPKNLKVDIGLQKMLTLLKQQGFEMFYIPKVYTQNFYGWQEFIRNKSTKNSDLSKIYKQYGSLAFIAYIFNITDLHMKNIIVSNDKVYLVDTESIFQYIELDDLNVDIISSQTYKIYDLIKNSVYATNLFPCTLGETGINISGILGHGNQDIIVDKIINNKSSEIKIIKARIKNIDRANIPNCIDYKLVYNFSKFITDEFRKLYIFFIKNSSKILSWNFWEYIYAGVSRIIFKNTNSYSSILNTYLNPIYYNDISIEANIFNFLKIKNNSNSIKYNIFNSEKSDIKNFDIPYFYKYNNSDDIYNSSHNYLYTLVRGNFVLFTKQKIISLNLKDLEQQIFFIELAMFEPIPKRIRQQNIPINFDGMKIEKSTIEQSIKQLTKKIINDSFMDEYGVNWLDLQIQPSGNWLLKPCNYKLYDGLSGICIVFGILYKYYFDKNYLQIIKKIIREIEIQIDTEDIYSDLSVFNGIGSVIYMYIFLGILLDDNKLQDKGINILFNSFKYIGQFKKLDFISGLAGYLQLCCQIYQIYPKYQEEIKKNIQKISCVYKELWNERECFISDIGYKYHLNGMAHGLSGIVYALNEANKILIDDDISNMIQQCINLENKSILNNNWIDLRNVENRKLNEIPNPVHWCHGSAGIGLSRLYLNILKDIDMAKKSVIDNGIEYSSCLCHGTFGNIDLFIEDYVINENINSLDISREISTYICQHNKFICGLPHKQDIYGLMLGFSGMIYELMRVLFPNDIPSILLIKLPSLRGNLNEKDEIR